MHDTITVFTATVMHESLTRVYVFLNRVLCDFAHYFNFDVHLLYGLKNIFLAELVTDTGTVLHGPMAPCEQNT
jgi:hypothetical protein